MTKIKVLIVMDGGLIQNICCTHPDDVAICRVDYDVFQCVNGTPDQVALEACYVEPQVELMSTGKWADTMGTTDLSKRGVAVKSLMEQLDIEFPLTDKI